MAVMDGLEFGVNGIIAIFIFIIFFSALAPSVIGYIQNNSSSIGLSETTILIFSLLGLIFVLGIFMKLWKKITGEDDERPRIVG